ncbi:hypothetical protein LF41_580 [Lysobacter dokdonensis DS-58]|uniref:Class IIb bacteriocin, lactobin A/cerein 7B family n=1 Tax=Lysobacter dokdonensis DS-58 TaxID=1300345 RepID=A0A0A2WZZ2_9GAMM|nr:class IIb bacteriocin, lactobin A/cerein 7B family [Lysobacter dokdonensis]KGQ18554.1 hypothetical protein LF41_580 [Lysobacter dokdonensis DS-58]
MGKRVRELSESELEQVNGGTLATAIALAALGGAVFAFGYEVGKDMAARDAR